MIGLANLNLGPTAIIAIFALLLGIYNAYVHWKDKQPSIRVTACEGDLFSIGISALAIFIEGYNRGQTPINIISHTLCLPKYGIVIQFKGTHKTKVLPGAIIRRWEFADIVADCLSDWLAFLKHKSPKTVKLEAWLTDEVGRIYKSKPFEFGIELAIKESIITESNKDRLTKSAISFNYCDPFCGSNLGNRRRELWLHKERLKKRFSMLFKWK